MRQMFSGSVLTLIILLIFGVLPLRGQTDTLRVSIANMSQDISQLSQQMRALNLEMDDLRRDNARLRAQVAAAASNQEMQAQINNLSSAIEILRQEYRKADEAQKQQIIAEVSKQIDVLAKETQSALDRMAAAVTATPNVPAPVRFSEDYPQTGIPYVVRRGDTLSGIARQHGSTIKYIQNANRIVDPSRDLQVGETIFIPIPE